MDMKQAWAEYKEKALKVPLLTAAGLAKASLKKMGASHVGPCPSCGGKDCFSVNHRSDGGWYWNCRREGTGGETSIGLICHAMGVDSDTAKEILTGDPLPTGKTTWSESERRAFDERRETAQRETENEEGDRSQSEDRALLKAQRIWDASDTMKGTPAELYLLNRGHPLREWPDCFRFHPAVEYEHLAKFEEYERDGRTYHRKVKAGPKLPCFVCRVDDVLGDLTGIWRIYITEDGQKARVPDQPGCKIGLGPVRGGAVRLSEAHSGEVTLVEGVETGNRLFSFSGVPTWATLSTSGLRSFQVPAQIELVRLYGDGDHLKWNTVKQCWMPPPGESAMLAAKENIMAQGVPVVEMRAPRPGRRGRDWENVANAVDGTRYR
ncbi:DUF7146 domain-containing protein [Pseudovibrio ascidiaceicola]|uniref:DUF7146 domain-containing protein n=1 Tax=Pseudovibrio ascidiaceicola TaxID=285279 RepID=UPI003D36E4DB